MSADVWYLDSSAFVKLVRREAETRALTRWLRGRRTCSSDLLRTEVRRAVTDEGPDVRALCTSALASLTLIRLTPQIFDAAGELAGATLRSLDALHLQAARALGADLAGIVTYDRRLTDAAASFDMAVAAPA
jgi:predicted nucleic acid-binding protein